jgi:hypothetical protein
MKTGDPERDDDATIGRARHQRNAPLSAPPAPTRRRVAEQVGRRETCCERGSFGPAPPAPAAAHAVASLALGDAIRSAPSR